MNSCKTCKHWQKPKGNGDQNSIVAPFHPSTFDYLTDEQIIEFHGHIVRYCTHPKVVFYEYPQQDGVALLDGSEYHAAMATAENFGCVLHES